jgi:hypothetical protein
MSFSLIITPVFLVKDDNYCQPVILNYYGNVFYSACVWLLLYACVFAEVFQSDGAFSCPEKSQPWKLLA